MMDLYELDGQLTLLDPEGWENISARSGPKRSGSNAEELVSTGFLLLDLTPGHCDLLGDPYWLLRSPWRDDGPCLNTGVAPRTPNRASLSSILEPRPGAKYYLSKSACIGILRRAQERGKELPPQLKAALMTQAGLIPIQAAAGGLKAFHINQRDEGIDLGEVSGALMATANMQMQTFVTGTPVAFAAQMRAPMEPSAAVPLGRGGARERSDTLPTGGVERCGLCDDEDEVRDLHDVAGALCAGQTMKQQTFVAEGCLNPWDTQQKRVTLPGGVAPTLAGADGGGGRAPGGLLLTAAFSAGAGATAGGIGYSEAIAPTLKGSPSGNCMPSVLCLNDQGGAVMECSRDITGTLRAQEHGHQPLVFENHGIDSRYTGPHQVAPTLSARAGTGGNNLPLVTAEPAEETPILCITGNAIDRQPKNGGNGLGIDEGVAFTLTATDRHAVFSRQHKDATDLVYQETVGAITCGDSKGPNNQYVGQNKLVVDGPLLIRRLTPLECERLQGFPDGWTALESAADSARYKALGNSVAIPCVDFVIGQIVQAAQLSLPYICRQLLCCLW